MNMAAKAPTEVSTKAARRVAAAALVAGVAAASLGGCSTPDAGARVDPIGPSVEQFAYVAPVLARRCGSIDCHGSKFRNFRVYGYGGQRLAPSTSPDVFAHIEPAEATATYESVIALEPEIMRAVVTSGGAGVERLTLVRKGRGDEEHKGHRRITPGDPSDRCITSWLQGNVAKAECMTGGCFTTDKTPFPIITDPTTPCL